MYKFAAYGATLLALLGGAQAQEVTTESVPLSAPSAPPQTGCPTATETREMCSRCAVPACIVISTVTNSPECPRAVPTEFLDFPCNEENEDTECAGLGCTTTYTIVDYPVGHETSSPEPSLPSVSSTPTGGNSTASTSEPPHESVTENAAGRMAIPFAGWF